MVMAASGTTKRKRVSKKLKGSWRKHVDIKDVEEFLEEKRLEERLGPSLSTLSDNDLFVLDTKPSQHLVLSKADRKLRAKIRPIKCFSALQSHSNVSDPIVKRNRVRSKEERKNDLIKKTERQNGSRQILKAKEIQSIADRRLYEIKRESRPKIGEFIKDIWSDESHNELQRDKWIEGTTKIHNLRGVGIPVKTVRKSKEKNSSLPSVEPPHPGMSYNPSFKDHQSLLGIIAEKETKLIKEEVHLNRVTKDMFSKVSEKERDDAWMIEMSEGLPSQDGTNAEENEASDSDYKALNPPTKNKKKTLKQRKKQKEQLALEKARKALKMEKKKISDIHRLNLLHRQIASVERKQSELQEKRKKVQEIKKNRPKVLSSIKYKDPDLEFNMAEDITGNLRSLKKEGSLLTDRFISLQKRNILQPSKRHIHKKAKVKKYVRPGHKDDWEKTVAR